MKTLITTILCLLALVSYAQNKKARFEFEKTGNHKSVFLNEGREVTVVTKNSAVLQDTIGKSLYQPGPFAEPTLFKENSSRYHGFLEALTDSFVIIYCYLQTQNVTYENDSSMEVQKSYDKNPIIQKIPLGEIDYIEYHSKTGRFFAIGMALSYVTLVVGAPLIAYNYSSGTFNGELYLTIVKYSALASLVTEIPFFITAMKTCRIKRASSTGR